MAIRKKTVAYYACDRCRLQEQETEKHCPGGWRYLHTIIPGKEKQNLEIKALICPTCDEWLKQQLDAICVQQWQEEEEVATGSTECAPPGLLSGVERRNASSIAPIRQLFEQWEEEVEGDSSECAPAGLSSGTERRNASSIAPIRQLFKLGEEQVEADSSEHTPLPLSSVPEQRELPKEALEPNDSEFTPPPLSFASGQPEPSAEDIGPGGSECTTSSPPLASEQREPPVEDPEPDGRECTPSPLASVTEQPQPPAIASIRRLFDPGEAEVESGSHECLPSLVSYGTKPSTIDSIRKLIHHS